MPKPYPFPALIHLPRSTLGLVPVTLLVDWGWPWGGLQRWKLNSRMLRMLCWHCCITTWRVRVAWTVSVRGSNRFSHSSMQTPNAHKSWAQTISNQQRRMPFLSQQEIDASPPCTLVLQHLSNCVKWLDFYVNAKWNLVSNWSTCVNKPWNSNPNNTTSI